MSETTPKPWGETTVVGCCTSGQIVSVEALLRKTPSPTLEEIREGVSGNLCRCGAYGHIFKAAQRAAQLKQAGR